MNTEGKQTVEKIKYRETFDKRKDLKRKNPQERKFKCHCQNCYK